MACSARKRKGQHNLTEVKTEEVEESLPWRILACATPRKKRKRKGQDRPKEVSSWKTPLEEEGLLCRILALLPLLKLLEIRRVCKLWDSVVCSRSLSEAWSARHDRQPWLVMARRPDNTPSVVRELAAFDMASGTWISFAALLQRTSRSKAALAALGGPSFPLVVNPTFDRDSYVLLEFKAVGSQEHSGLVCFLCNPFRSQYSHTICKALNDGEYAAATLELFPSEVFHYSAYYLLVLNPFTGTHTILPPPLKHTEGFRVEEDDDLFSLGIYLQALPDHHYRVFMIPGYMYDHPGDLEIYDSRTASWRAGRSCLSDADAKIGGAKELERADFLHFSSVRFIIFAYNYELDEWSRLSVVLPNNTGFGGSVIGQSALFRHKGRVFVAVAQFHAERYADVKPHGFAVWELHAPFATEVADWVEAARTPSHFWKDVHEAYDIKIVYSGGLICMTAICGDKYLAPLVYDLDREAWYQLPPYKGQNLSVVFGMRPTLVTNVA